MHLKEAREKGKMKQFIAENEKKYPRASRKHFHGSGFTDKINFPTRV